MIKISHSIYWLNIAVFNLIISGALFASPINKLTDVSVQRGSENRKDFCMAERDMSFIKIADMVRRAHMQASGVVTDGDRQSFPIPIIHDGEPWIVFLFSLSLARPTQPTKIYPPSHYLRLHACTGKLKELVFVTPKNFNQKHAEDEMLGELSMPAGFTFEEYTFSRNRLYEVYDELLPFFFVKEKIESPQLRVWAREFNQLFSVLSEQPLFPYYQAVGGQFFDWVNELEKQP